ncbi:MAG TPA: diphosphomevalonate decarboxylase [candidate division Zixibacteria bacterium]|nr:diphosphomevalonate decarboxylase [candidate division Zixibacteria bacterium]
MKATAIAGSNIAFIKYWGNQDDDLRIPMNGSISMTLDAAHTTTNVEFNPNLADDSFTLNGSHVNRKATARVSKHLDHIRKIANSNLKAVVSSQNSFPTGAGIASSASGFAALTVAASKALRLDLTRSELGRIARLGSGSACRSIDGGFVEWHPGGSHEDSYAVPIAPSDHWDLVDIVAIISSEHKDYGSSTGHTLAHSSPFYQARLGRVGDSLAQVRQAILEKDFAALGRLIEEEAIQLHVTAMTSIPSVLYWRAGTLNVIHALRSWRKSDPFVPGYFTIDAGANVHIISERKSVPALLENLKTVDGVEEMLVSHIGGEARVIDGVTA